VMLQNNERTLAQRRDLKALGRELRMRVIVEGVETLKQPDFLHDSGGDQVQGFYFGRPLPAAEINANILADVARPAPAPAHG
jgi:EAL domain-containing protein (putative c-di-GMP-specific phosphodiesterase class I)